MPAANWGKRTLGHKLRDESVRLLEWERGQNESLTEPKLGCRGEIWKEKSHFLCP